MKKNNLDRAEAAMQYSPYRQETTPLVCSAQEHNHVVAIHLGDPSNFATLLHSLVWRTL